MLAFLAAGLAIGVLVARLLGRRRTELAYESPTEPDPRADALRAKLAAAREGDDGPASSDELPAGDVDEARRAVHERGRATVEEMRRAGNGG
jgi:hypothetical protein